MKMIKILILLMNLKMMVTLLIAKGTAEQTLTLLIDKDIVVENI